MPGSELAVRDIIRMVLADQVGSQSETQEITVFGNTMVEGSTQPADTRGGSDNQFCWRVRGRR